MSFRHQTLANGLTVLAEPNPSAHSFAAGLFVRTGSRDEPSGLNGVSHFLEHMLFKGAADTDAQAMNRIFDELGARYNAFTTQEMTAYYGQVIPQFSGRLLEHLRELFRPALRVEDFETEKQVILEEIAMYNDEPGQRVYERVMEQHFGDHPLGRSVIGTADVIAPMRRDDMAAYFERHYSPANLVLVASGAVDPAWLFERAEALFGGWRGEHVERSYAEPAASGRRVDLADAKLNRAYLMALVPGPSAQDEDRFAARVLADLVGDSEGSRLYWALVDNAICEDADFGFYPHDRAGSFYLSLQTDRERLDEALEIARETIARVREDLSEDEVLRARNKLASGITIGGESPGGRMRAIGSEWLYTGTYRSVADDLASLKSIDRSRVLEMLERYTFEPMTVVTLAPEA